MREAFEIAPPEFTCPRTLNDTMNFDEVLLALLARRPRSGYELKKWLDVEGIFIRASADQSQIYRTLRRLEKHDLVEHGIVRKGGPDAKIYRVTPSGADRLRELAEAPYEPPARWQEADFIARVSLLGPVSPRSIIAIVDRELEFRHEQMLRFRGRSRDDSVLPGAVSFDPDVINNLNAELDLYGRESTNTWIVWLEGLREQWIRQLGYDGGPSSMSESSASSSAS